MSQLLYFAPAGRRSMSLVVANAGWSARTMVTSGKNIDRHPQLEKFMLNQLYLDGRFRPAISKNLYQTFDPATGTIVAQAPEASVEDARMAVEAARRAWPGWSSTTAKVRADLLDRFYRLQLQHAEPLAQLISLEMGKPIRESRGEIAYGASFLQWFAHEARRISGEVIASPWPDRRTSYVKESIGVAAIITPWNFPNAMITRKIGAALAAGCPVVIKPATETPFSALALAALAHEAGFPSGVVNVLPTSHAITPSIGEYLCTAPEVAVISFTGSTAVGKLLARQSVSTLKRVCMELGGDAPFIVFDSADVDKAVAGCLASKFRNTGQTCVCTNRILVQAGVYDRFVSTLVEAISRELHFGPTLDEATTIGPLVSRQAVLKVMRHVEDAIGLGARLMIGGASLERENTVGASLFYKPTVLTEVTPEMKVFREETFGPVAAIAKFETEKQALDLANDTRFGLAGYFYSQNYAQIERVTRHLQVGMVGVNEGVISTCEAPFGGVKESGIGREGSHFGLEEYLQVKYVCLGGLDFTLKE